jgi:DNA-binding LytR/AlgR family response regulator
MFNALLVEDEPAALRELECLLDDHAQMRVQARALSLEQAIAAVQAAPPDLVFLDLQLGTAHGAALLPLLPSACHVVITTAYSDFAIPAFEAGVRDYLLKPIRPERLALCLERVLGSPADTDASAPSDADGFWLDSPGCRDFVRLDDVLWVVAMRKNSHLQLAKQDPLVLNRSISEWDALLPLEQFQRLDRSTIVRLSALRTVKRVSRSLTLLFFHGFEQPLAVGPTAARRLKELLAGE